MNFYTPGELQLIVTRGARVLGCPMTEDGAREIACRSRGDAHVSLDGLLRRVRDFAVVAGTLPVNAAVADYRIDPAWRRSNGIWMPWIAVISRVSLSITTADRWGVETLAAALSEQRDTLEEVIEPYLLQQGLLQRTPRGPHAGCYGISSFGLDAHFS